MKQNLLSLTIGALLLFIVCLLLFVFQVRTSEVVVVTRFGRPDRSVTDPGPHWRLPWPIEKPHRFDQRTQNFEDKLTEGLTEDSFNLLTSVYVGWKITDPAAFFPKFAGTDQPIAEAEKVLERMLSNSKAAIIGKHPLVDFLSTDPQANRFAAIENEILALVQSQVKVNNYGLEIKFLGLKKLGLPESVTQSVFERMTKEREVLATKSQAEGESEAAKIRSGAGRKAAEMLAAAKGEATQIVAKGEAEAAKYLDVFQQNPELASFLFRLTALENSLKERSILIFDQHTAPYDLFQGPSTNLLNSNK
jgi:modulator of FtsH protease HflC